MAMEVQFSCLAPTTRTVNIPEEDMAALYDIVVRQFLAVLPHMEFDSRTLSYMPERKALAEFAQKYGVTVAHGPSLEAFYRAALGKSNE
jgi:hypothetical protein